MSDDDDWVIGWANHSVQMETGFQTHTVGLRFWVSGKVTWEYE